MDTAHHVFDEIPEHDVVSQPIMMVAYNPMSIFIMQFIFFWMWLQPEFWPFSFFVMQKGTGGCLQISTQRKGHGARFPMLTIGNKFIIYKFVYYRLKIWCIFCPHGDC